MKLSEVLPHLEQNKAAAAGVGAVAVVGFALYQKRKSGTSTTGTGADVGTALSSGSQTAAMSGGIAYDSSSSDTYNALQPQLEAIGQQLDQMQNATTIPVPAPPQYPTGLIPTPAPSPAPVTPTTIPKAVAKPVAPPKAPAPVTYRVKPGDNLSKIAAMFPSRSITATSIYNANRGTIGSDKNLIKPGQNLVIR